ncbi:MAG TPA: hypothetical protein ENI34_05265 [candidate division WOR-3 bacterium]|uniref:Guanylate cyclase domain-containing protein n=1 Tax=candidate division WOR-3 bacterium TaxID=2052148 RepID=A0A9C9K055_UNCW3|nr:hypothetical protein [candidate division WOR-3 bacterium]
MKRAEFEDIIILNTPYYRNLEKTYRDTINFTRYIDILKRVVQGDGFIEALEKKGGKELVYLGRKIFSLQEEFVTNYIQFLSDDSLVNKWEKFFERYSTQLFEIYENFVAGESNKILIFEIVNRKLLRDFLTKQTVNKPLEQRMNISERFGVVVNQLFSYIRNSLTKNIPVADALIVSSYEKIPFLPRCSHSETMKLLSRCFLEKGLPEPVFTAMIKNIMISYYVATKEKVINAINSLTYLNRDKIMEIFKSHFFFPDDDSLNEILELLKKKAFTMLESNKEKRNTVDKKIREMKQKIKETTNAIKEELMNLTENFSTEESVDNILKKLRRNLIGYGYDLRFLKNEYEEYVKKDSGLKSILNFKTSDLQKFIFKNEWDPYLILFFNTTRKIPEERLQLLIKNVMGEIKGNKTALEVMSRYKISGFLKEKYNGDAIMEKFNLIIDQVILPLVKSFLLEELIEYYPKLSGGLPSEGIRYLSEEALAGRVNLVEKEMNVMTPKKTVSPLAISHFKNLISVLIYDIRGSTFMGTKLRDAKRENEIRNYFQESMLAAVEKYGGIPIKDTGDGGIVLFAANNHDIKNKKTTELEGGSVLSAVRSGLEMVQCAKNFVQENINKYQDWFRETEERKINFEGATYATLPPSYQSIFQIGVGIASGAYPKEVYLDKNAFGELDLTGMLVREANFYSKVKAKSKSTVICDDATVYNLLLNVNKFSFLSETGLRIDPLLLDIEQGLEYWINQKVARRGFILDLYKIFVTQLGQEVSRPGSLKIMLGIFDIEIDETGEIKDGKGGRGKFLFEVSSEAVK